MLEPDARKRATAAGVLRHGWVRDAHAADRAARGASAELLSGHRALVAGRRGLLALDVGADAAFDALDANGDGRIDRAELAAGMRRLGQNLDDAALDAM